MRQITYAVVCLLVASSAHAASFDCTKHLSRVERWVCGDAELSALDDKVNAAYEAALQDKDNAWLVTQDHAAWIAWRRGSIVCPGSIRSQSVWGSADALELRGCLRGTYLDELFWLKRPIPLTIPAGGAQAAGGAVDSATLMNDGKVQLVGNWGGALYDAATGCFSDNWRDMNGQPPRIAPFIIPLGDGRLLVAGGWEVVLGEPSAMYSWDRPISAPKIYDPATHRYTASGSFPPELKGSATLLQNGKVLIAGGATPPPLMPSRPPYGASYSYIINASKIHPQSSREAVLFDPGTGQSAATGKLLTPRALNSATLLADGRVLIFGGSADAEPVSAEIYDPTTGSFTATGAPAEKRMRPATLLLPNGKVLVIGGWQSWNPRLQSGTLLDTAELYDPADGRFTATGKLHAADEWTPLLLRNGKVLVVGGGGRAEFYDSVTGEFTPVGKFRFGSQKAVLLGNGKIFLLSGRGGELFDPAAPGNAPTKAVDGRVLAAHCGEKPVALPRNPFVNGVVVRNPPPAPPHRPPPSPRENAQ